ncbi:FtsW/RodA/SpoVE family cell cycle protein [Paenibacillus sp. FSL R5-0517]|uniref:FtsW/RodA/SpoVE family cell cycle protein n=1 Tax=Paenibacillus sp. FSL R5-0517 TaxID=2921647 RepID=UPI0030D7C74C
MTNRDERIQHYLDHMCVEVKAREVHNDLRDELGNHMEEIILDKEQEGYTEEEAIAYAIEQMGDPAVVGKSMHRLHRHRMHWGLLVGLIALSIISLFLMWVFTINVADEKYQFLYRNHVVYTVIGVMLMLFFIYFDYRKLKKAAWWIYILLNVMLWISPMITTDIYGNSRYWSLFGLTLDLTTASVWILPLAIGAIMVDKLRSNCNMQSILTYIAMVTIPAVLLFQTLDWVRLFLFGIMSIILFGWLTRKWLYTVIGAVITGIIFVLLLFFADQYGRLVRLTVVLNLQDDPYGSAYSNYSIIEIIRSSGWWGNGIDTTFDRFKTSYFNYPGVLLIDVFGWSAGILLLVAIIWFVANMVKMLPRIWDDFGRMIIVSITAMFAMQIIYSLAMTTGKAPIISITFPLIGYGNHLMFDYAMLGLLLGIYRRKDTTSKKNDEMPKKMDADLLTNS